MSFGIHRINFGNETRLLSGTPIVMIFDPAEEKILYKTEVLNSILATIVLQNGFYITGIK